jgi:hypothetical protein
LKIKPASEYAAAEKGKITDKALDRLAKVVDFLNDEVTPKIEDMIANPDDYTVKGYASFRVLIDYPASEFVKEVSSLLTPLGFTVKDSHDGAGMFATVIIQWDKKIPEIAVNPWDHNYDQLRRLRQTNDKN